MFSSANFLRRDWTCLGQRLGFTEEPVVAMLPFVPQDVQFVIAHDALGVSGLDAASHKFDNGGTIRPTVDQVAQEDQPPPTWMNAVFPIAKMVQQIVEGVDLTVDIAHNVEGTGEQRLY